MFFYPAPDRGKMQVLTPQQSMSIWRDAVFLFPACVIKLLARQGDLMLIVQKRMPPQRLRPGHLRIGMDPLLLRRRWGALPVERYEFHFLPFAP